MCEHHGSGIPLGSHTSIGFAKIHPRIRQRNSLAQRYALPHHHSLGLDANFGFGNELAAACAGCHTTQSIDSTLAAMTAVEDGSIRYQPASWTGIDWLVHAHALIAFHEATTTVGLKASPAQVDKPFFPRGPMQDWQAIMYFSKMDPRQHGKVHRQNQRLNPQQIR
jgi:hypothetical protein